MQLLSCSSYVTTIGYFLIVNIKSVLAERMGVGLGAGGGGVGLGFSSFLHAPKDTGLRKQIIKVGKIYFLM